MNMAKNWNYPKIILEVSHIEFEETLYNGMSADTRSHREGRTDMTST
jgi:hypothetical protein